MNKIWLALITAIAASIVAAPTANADGNITSRERDYIDAYAPEICDRINDHPTPLRLIVAALIISDFDGFKIDDSVDIVGMSIIEECPEFEALIAAAGNLDEKVLFN